MAADPTFPKDGSWTPYGTNVTFRAEANSFKGPSAGVAFKKMGNAINSNGGPFQVKNITGQTDKIMIKSGTTEPVVGMEIVFPYYGEEGLITYVEKETGTGKDHYNIWVEDKLGFRIDQKIKNKNETFVICYYMSRFAYVVENGELRLYSTAPPPEGVTWPVVVARNIINEADRTLPAKPFSQASTDYVGINLTTEDDRYTNRNFKAVNTLLAGSVPIRAQISKVQ